MARPKYPSDDLAQFMIRIPPGLRDRIKAYAGQKGRSMNAEIVRILEMHFPEPWPVEARIEDLLRMLSALEADFEETKLHKFVDSVDETIRGIVSGRVRGLEVETRERIRHLYEAWKEIEHEFDSEALNADYDEEEREAIKRIGRPEKYIDTFDDDDQ